MYLSFSTTFMMSLERCVATFNLASYDKNRSVGPCLVAIQVLMAAVFISAIYMQFELPQSMAYCLIASMTSVLMLYSQILIFLIFQLIAIIIFHYLIKFNLKMKTELLTRNDRRLFSKGQVITKLYQVRENLRTMKTLFLFFFVSCIVSFVSNSLRGAVHYHKKEFSQTTYYGLIELSISLPPYSVAVPVILWYSYRRVRQKIAQKHRNIREFNTSTNSNRSHFSVLRESWK
ncbi:hypothetical protein OESDEN_19740 [Oesophagostomum dentatum]|uniref:G-protein coupled receptors family 1 profile domain-containing protein n=1 Tax=Oesophagostomum dentatum TaxID=61180 RepID=A0A0B1S5F4_OESDE|nr:hypothetical protein OESDEN_19740 [Oesophagostomum dentatum]